MIFFLGTGQTDDTFILDGYVYWRYLWYESTIIPGGTKNTVKSQYYKFGYKDNTKVDIDSITFYEKLKEFNKVKYQPEYLDAVIGDALESIWLVSVLYKSDHMNF